MAGVERQRRRRQRKRDARQRELRSHPGRRRRNPFAELPKIAHRVGLTGSQQWPLALHVMERGWKVSRCVYLGADAAAKALGGERPLDRCNTKRRLHNLETRYGLWRIVRGGGRRRGCSKDDGLVGLTNRVYPGPMLVPAQVVDRWIAEDNQRELDKPGEWTYPPRRLELQRQIDELRAGQLDEESRAGP